MENLKKICDEAEEKNMQVIEASDGFHTTALSNCVAMLSARIKAAKFLVERHELPQKHFGVVLQELSHLVDGENAEEQRDSIFQKAIEAFKSIPGVETFTREDWEKKNSGGMQ